MGATDVQMDRHNGLRGIAAVVGTALMLGCSTPDAPSAGPTDPPAPGPSADATEVEADNGVGVTVEADVDGLPTRLVVGPIVRDGELAVLRVSAQVLSGQESLSLQSVFGFVFRDIGRPRPDNLRLVDVERLTVTLTARDADHNQAVELPDSAEPGGEPVQFHPVFAAPAGDSVAVLVPQVGLVEDVPVVDAGTPAAAVVQRTVDDVAAEIEAVPADLELRTYPLDSYRELGGAVRARESQEQLEVAVDTDVLFAVDS